jgi:hypothetical protein
MAKVILVIETEDRRGLGKSDDPVRLVKQYWSIDGRLLAEVDHWLMDKVKQDEKP